MAISKTQPMRSAEIDVIDYVNNIESYVDEINTLIEDVDELQLTVDGYTSQNTIKDADESLSNRIDSINSTIGNGFVSETITQRLGNAFILIYDLIGDIGSGFDSENTVSNAISTLNETVSNFISNFRFGKTNLITITPNVTESVEVSFDNPFEEQSSVCVFLCLINETEPFNNINLILTSATYEGFTFDISSIDALEDVYYSVGYVAVKIN